MILHRLRGSVANVSCINKYTQVQLLTAVGMHVACMRGTTFMHACICTKHTIYACVMEGCSTRILPCLAGDRVLTCLGYVEFDDGFDTSGHRGTDGAGWRRLALVCNNCKSVGWSCVTNKYRPMLISISNGVVFGVRRAV